MNFAISHYIGRLIEGGCVAVRGLRHGLTASRQPEGQVLPLKSSGTPELNGCPRPVMRFIVSPAKCNAANVTIGVRDLAGLENAPGKGVAHDPSELPPAGETFLGLDGQSRRIQSHVRRCESRHAKYAQHPKPQLSQFTPARICLCAWPLNGGIARLSPCGGELGQLVFCVNLSPKLYSQIIRDRRISHGAFRVWHLLRDMTGNNATAWPSLSTICRTIGCGKAALRGWIVELATNGYVSVVAGTPRRSNRYAVLCRTAGGFTQNRSGSKQDHELNSVNQTHGIKGRTAFAPHANAIHPTCEQDAPKPSVNNHGTKGARRMFASEVKHKLDAIRNLKDKATERLDTYRLKPGEADSLKTEIKRLAALETETETQLAHYQ